MSQCSRWGRNPTTNNITNAPTGIQTPQYGPVSPDFSQYRLVRNVPPDPWNPRHIPSRDVARGFWPLMFRLTNQGESESRFHVSLHWTFKDFHCGWKWQQVNVMQSIFEFSRRLSDVIDLDPLLTLTSTTTEVEKTPKPVTSR